MFLDYLSLVLLLMGLTLLFYGFIYIHDIPYTLAKKNHHAQSEAIHIACWLSLFTLHAIWPIVFIWAILKPKPMQVVIENPHGHNLAGHDHAVHAPEDLPARIRELEERLAKLEQHAVTSTAGEKA